MSALVVAVLPPGRIFAYSELYPVPSDSVVHANPIAVPQEVQINEITDDTKYLWAIGFSFVGPRLVTGRA